MFKKLKSYIILIAILLNSSIFAINVNFSNPSSTPPGTPPDLSVTEEDALTSQIATDSSGNYVYAVWTRSNGTNTISQVAISSDAGVTWQDPTTTPPGTTTPNLSDPGPPGGNAFTPQITTNSSGRYVYALWYRSDGSNNIIQLAISSDFGVTWQDPTSTPQGSSIPDLSDTSKSSVRAQITTDSSGKYVYAVWQILDGAKTVIQAAISSDFGKTWQDPTSTPPTTTSPNLSNSSESADLPQITTDSTGRYVYAIWF